MTELSTKQLRLQKKADKQQRRLDAKANRQSAATGSLIWKSIAIIVIIFGLIYWISSSEPRPGVAVDIQGRSHITLGDEHDPYLSNPPTSGPHSGPASLKMHDTEIPDEQAIHNLEHGQVWLSYRDLDPDTIAQIREIRDRYPSRLLVSPRAANDAPIVLASWGRMLELDSFDRELILLYIRKNTNKSPEPFAS